MNRKRHRRRPPIWLAIIGALVVLVAAAWAVRESPSIAPDGVTDSRAAEAAMTTAIASTRTAPVVTPERRAMARLAKKKLRITNGSGRKKLVALTFDDGPGPLTKQLLSTLNRLDAPSTFFVQGGLIASHPEVVKAAVRHGHEIGIHTWNHPDLTGVYGDELRHQIYDTRDEIRRYAGVDPGLIRPPYGAIDDRVIRDLAPGRFVQVLWDVDTNDWRGLTPRQIVDHVLANATAGSIVLMHDGGTARRPTLDAVEPIIKGLRARGLEPVTVSELLRADPPKEAAPARATGTTAATSAPMDASSAPAVDPASDLPETYGGE